MAEPIKSITVVLEDGVRSEEAEALCQAIRCMRRVIAVTPNAADWEHHAAKEQAKREMGEKIIQVIYPKA
jgi:hypothetical protein